MPYNSPADDHIFMSTNNLTILVNRHVTQFIFMSALTLVQTYTDSCHKFEGVTVFFIEPLGAKCGQEPCCVEFLSVSY